MIKYYRLLRNSNYFIYWNYRRSHVLYRNYSKSNWSKEILEHYKKIKNGIYDPAKSYNLKHVASPIGVFFSTQRRPMNLKLMTGLVFMSVIALHPFFGSQANVLFLIPVFTYLKRRYFSGPKTEMTLWESVICYEKIMTKMQTFPPFMEENKMLKFMIFAVMIPNREGQVGMAVIEDKSNSLKIDSVSQFFTSISRDCAIPIFIRIVPALNKSINEYMGDGYNVNNIADTIYYYHTRERKYSPLNKSIYEDIIAGKIVF